ncbi:MULTISPECIES: STAS domain-containing protein [Legionella]|uniref:Anti-anti-sigma factor n=1 Tax=Legionella drozanskii LLAP-1 TaxID=1212489 RepID=A0A0W0SQS1_9GAMM|nr:MULTISPECIES: STAS domain-containing protein [Legionella]KTC85601.1 anti-anti-sigma factor [Legionella drozanskii LLAP-1]
MQSFKPSTEMIFATVQSDCQRMLKFFHNNKEAVLHLDLSEVLHCDSAGLALLIEAKRLSAEQNKTCEIDGMPKAIQALAEFCGVDAMLGLCR